MGWESVLDKVAKEGLSEVNAMKMTEEGNDVWEGPKLGGQQVYKPQVRN